MPGFSCPNSCAWLMCTQLASTLSVVVDAGANAEFGLEQHAAAESDLVVGGSWNLLGRAVVDGDPEPGTDVDLGRRTSPTVPTARVTGVAGRI